jgi:hypothetical protein
MKIQELSFFQSKRKVIVVGLVSIPCLIAICISACMNGRAGAKPLTTQHNTKDLMASVQQNLEQEKKQINAMNEWSAFSIYHPHSQVNEEALFQTFRKRKENNSDNFEKSNKTVEKSETSFLLSGQALIPILKSTFGDQIRSGNDIERDAWFTTHPSALFTPDQLKSLCNNDFIEIGEGNFEVCWKPKLTDQYLSALTDFATDACPQLVAREVRNNALQGNKLIRTRDFREQNLKTFAITWLKLPSEKVSEGWLAEITTQARAALKANVENNGEMEGEDGEVESLESSVPDLYTLSCQAMLLSPEFYSR